MAGLFENIKSIKQKVCVDNTGYIEALLSDLEDDPDYDHWTNLICLLKYEIEDEEEAFDIFNEFSKQFDSYSKEETEKKFFDSNLEAGTVRLGSLVFWVQEALGDEYDQDKYSEFFGTESISKVKKFVERKERAQNKLPLHSALNDPTHMDLPDPIDPSNMAEILPPGLYVTGTSPYDFRLVDPFGEDQLEQYISVNPMKVGSTTRSQDNCASFDFAVIEFDEMKLEEQLGYLNAFNLPIEALVFTGNKSIHAWLRVDAKDLEQYRERTRLVQKMFQDIGVKPDTKVLVDPSSWVRCPGVDRIDWKNTGEVTGHQPLLYVHKSKGWDDWYLNTYPSIHDEETTEEIIKELPIDKEHNFYRFKTKMLELLGDDLTEDFTKNMAESEDIEGDIKDFMSEFYKVVKKITRMQILESNIYFLFRDPLLEAGLPYKDSLDQLLWEAIIISVDYDKERQKQYVKRLEEDLNVAKGYFKEYYDPILVEAFDKKLNTCSDNPEIYAAVCSSIVSLSEEIGFRLAVLTRNEIFKYTDKLGKLLKDEPLYPGHSDPLYYIYYDALHRYYEGDGLTEVTSLTFPSEINPICCFVRETEKGFKATELINDIALKILASRSFKKHFSKVEMISNVPVFYENNGYPILIDGYNRDTKVLVTTHCPDYKFLDLDEAKNIILDLFKDFHFVERSDLSRSVACLVMPAMCHAGLLKDDFRPLVYVASDKEGAGKGTLIQFLVYPYDEDPPMITQSDSAAANIDEKIGHAIHEGKNHIVLDNLKSTRQMKILDSPFLESLITSDSTPFREAHGRSTTLNTKHVTTYVTTNGITLSPDLADRSLFISIRHRGKDFDFREFDGGIKNYLNERRPLIMSAVYTVIKEYVSRGKGQIKPVEPHRFLSTVPILNKLVKDIFGLPDITKQNSKRAKGVSDERESTLRSICFSVDSAGKLEKELSSLSIFEILDEYGNKDLLGIKISDDELYTNESMAEFTREAKQKIGISIGRLFREEFISIDEFDIKRVSIKKSSAKYVFRKRK